MSTKKGIHCTPRITREEFELKGLVPASYSEDDISAALVNHLSRTKEQLTPTQLKGLARAENEGCWNLCKPENQEDLQRWFEIFNDIIFNGTLSGLVRALFPATPAPNAQGIVSHIHLRLPIWLCSNVCDRHCGSVDADEEVKQRKEEPEWGVQDIGIDRERGRFWLRYVNNDKDFD